MTDANAETLKLQVGGMDCAACASKIESAVGRLPGVSEARASFTTGHLSVMHDGSVAHGAVSREVKALGYSIVTHRPVAVGNALEPYDHDGPTDGPWWRQRKVVLTGLCGAALAAAFVIGQLMPQVGHWAFLLALVVGLVPIAQRAVMAATRGLPFTIETLMTIAAVGAVIIGATEEAATVVLLFLVGELLEGLAAGRARSSIRSLANLVPKTARLQEGDAVREVPADSLSVGATILVRPGDRIAADGEIIEGTSGIDESPVTGESIPKRKGVGDSVFAGTINTDAVLQVRVTATAADNTIARVVKLVEEAQDSKAPTERFIDQFSKYYTPGVLVVGALVAVVPPLLFGGAWSEWVYKGLAVLLIGCPCALVISTPAAIASGLSAGARRGMLLKGGAVLEGLRKVTVVALDKTGTLTEGRPVVTDVIPLGRTEREVLSLAAALETGSSHPLALAILGKAAEAKAPIPPAMDAKAIAGKGVSGKVGGRSVMLSSAQARAPGPHRQPQRRWQNRLGVAGRWIARRVACYARRAESGRTERACGAQGREHPHSHADGGQPEDR